MLPYPYSFFAKQLRNNCETNVAILSKSEQNKSRKSIKEIRLKCLKH
nr:MAG TPA: hypothetical protein [Caudoviricetes sp.]